MKKNDRNIVSTAIIVVIMYTGLTMALFYGIKAEWGAVFFSLLAALVAFICKKKTLGGG